MPSARYITIPAPTIAPTPMNAAWRTLRCLLSALPADDGSAASVLPIRDAPSYLPVSGAESSASDRLLRDGAGADGPGDDPGERSDRRTPAGLAHEAGRGLDFGP